jgi:serine/threonine protein kinase
VVGTPGFVAPEAVLAGGPPPTRSADVYGLAAVGYALLCGRSPAAGEDVLAALARSASRPPTPAELGIDVPAPLEKLLFQGLEADPRRRPSARRMAESFEGMA